MPVASKVGMFLPNLDTLGLWVLELFAMYANATDGQTDGRTKATLCPFPTGAGHKQGRRHNNRHAASIVLAVHGTNSIMTLPVKSNVHGGSRPTYCVFH